MKKVIISMLLITWIASPASACGKHKKSHKVAARDNNPAYIDHSYDAAYGSTNTSPVTTERSLTYTRHNSPLYIDHSYDAAYTGLGTAGVTPDPDTRVTMRPRRTMVDANVWAVEGKNNRYSLSDVSVYGQRSYRSTTMNAPYQGQDAPSYDGHIKNEYRNMRANNTSEELPSINGK